MCEQFFEFAELLTENMAKKIEDYRKKIIKILKDHQYSVAIDAQVTSLASAMLSLDIANEEIANLTETTVWETTRYGKKIAPHPVFKIAKDAQESITRNMKALKLTVEDLSGETDDDPMVNMTELLTKKRATPKIIKPGE